VKTYSKVPKHRHLGLNFAALEVLGLGKEMLFREVARAVKSQYHIVSAPDILRRRGNRPSIDVCFAISAIVEAPINSFLKKSA